MLMCLSLSHEEEKLPWIARFANDNTLSPLLRHSQSIQCFVKLLGGLAVKFWSISFFYFQDWTSESWENLISVRQQSDDGRYWWWSLLIMVAPTLFINDTGNDVHLLYRATLIFWWSLTIAVALLLYKDNDFITMSSLLLNSDICSSIPTLQNPLMVTDFLWMHYDFLSSPQFWHFSSIPTLHNH